VDDESPDEENFSTLISKKGSLEGSNLSENILGFRIIRDSIFNEANPYIGL
jgi:hypothetical protein